MTGSIGSLAGGGVALLAVLLLIALASRLIQAGGWSPRQQPGKLLALRESMALDTRRRLHLVQCGDRQVLLLTGGAQDLVVGWVATP